VSSPSRVSLITLTAHIHTFTIPPSQSDHAQSCNSQIWKSWSREADLPLAANYACCKVRLLCITTTNHCSSSVWRIHSHYATKKLRPPQSYRVWKTELLWLISHANGLIEHELKRQWPDGGRTPYNWSTSLSPSLKCMTMRTWLSLMACSQIKISYTHSVTTHNPHIISFFKKAEENQNKISIKT